MEIRDEPSLLNSFIKQHKNEESESMLSNFDKHYVYYIRPSDIKSYQTLKQAEDLLLSPESNVLNAQIKNSLVLITLNNFGQFYKKHMFRNIAELYFDLIMRLSQKHNISTVSMVSNMLRNCKNYS